MRALLRCPRGRLATYQCSPLGNLPAFQVEDIADLELLGSTRGTSLARFVGWPSRWGTPVPKFFIPNGSNLTDMVTNESSVDPDYALVAKVFSAKYLPIDGEWQRFRKVALTKMMRIDGPFIVETSEGPLTCQDGWVAIDARGYPYPIADSEQRLIYREVDNAE